MNYVDLLIKEVKERPVLWDRKYRLENKNEGWTAVASKLNKTPAEVRSKWRILKATFHREEKKVKLPPTNEGKPLISYYTGQWAYFEKLLFINTLNSEEFASSEYSDDGSNDGSFVDDKQNTHTETRLVMNIESEDNNSEIFESRKRKLGDTSQEHLKIRRNIRESPQDDDIDEDVLFVKSLVPFFRKLNPIRRLIIKNEMQNLLIKELLCDQCRTIGPQPDCRCNLN